MLAWVNPSEEVLAPDPTLADNQHSPLEMYLGLNR
jgi:hypothetical protein